MSASTLFRTTQLDKRLATVRRAMSPAEAAEALEACGPPGPDPSSAFFTPRRKSIAYVMRIGSNWFQLHADYFVQPERYNDFSGGYRRHFDQIDPGFVDHPAARKGLEAFERFFGLPEQELLLVQVQTSDIREDDPHRSLTGQGIHTDGHDHAMILCLERTNVTGAENSIHAELDGSSPVIHPFVLTPGDVLAWHDNRVFHSVAPARPADPTRPASRTVMLVHHPATHSLTGEINGNNDLGTTVVDADRRLRLRPELRRA